MYIVYIYIIGAANSSTGTPSSTSVLKATLHVSTCELVVRKMKYAVYRGRTRFKNHGLLDCNVTLGCGYIQGSRLRRSLFLTNVNVYERGQVPILGMGKTIHCECRNWGFGHVQDVDSSCRLTNLARSSHMQKKGVEKGSQETRNGDRSRFQRLGLPRPQAGSGRIK